MERKSQSAAWARTPFKVVWYPEMDQEVSLNNYEERPIVCYCTQEEIKFLLYMVAMETSYSLMR